MPCQLHYKYVMSPDRSNRGLAGPHSRFEALEPRLLLSASPFGTSSIEPATGFTA